MSKLGSFLLAACLFLVPMAAEAKELQGRAEIVDGDTIIIGETTIRLHGIDAAEAGQRCSTSSGKTWKCDDAAMDRLAALIGGPVTCSGKEFDGYDRLIAVCQTAEGIEINRTLVSEGFVWAFRKYSTDYVAEEDAARAKGIGVWQAPTQSPWDYRADRWAAAEQEAPGGCPIKGNISENGRIYHAPWSPWYKRTKVNLKKGERWFCTEREALDAGWRAPAWR